LTLYLDTCVLLAISGWCETELTSALGLEIRTNQLTAEQAESVLLMFQKEMAPALEHFIIVEQDFRNANGCLRGWYAARGAPSSGTLRQPVALVRETISIVWLSMTSASNSPDAIPMPWPAGCRACSVPPRTRSPPPFPGSCWIVNSRPPASKPTP
jgi:hypothetical protein